MGETRALMLSSALETHADRTGQKQRNMTPRWPERQGAMEADSPEDVSRSTSGSALGQHWYKQFEAVCCTENNISS